MIERNYYFGILSTLFIFWNLFPGNQEVVLPQSMEEICENGIDDDDDGLIDLNDPDCECEIIRPESLIPNPSFEERTCCPFFGSQLQCANDWIQASEATTDYVHSCGYQGHHQVPLPIPDGEACIGFRDGRPNQPRFKEYTGACLVDTMQPNINYLLNFWVGFASQSISPATTMSVFGTSNCSNLPFGIGNENFGCPANDPNWFLIGDVDVSGGFGWENVELAFEPDVPITAIVIGPDCELHQSTVDRYYFFDALTLALESDFAFRIKDLEGHPCTEDLILGVPDVDTLNFQWFKDGIAIVGETNSTYEVPAGAAGEGSYQLRVEGQGNCLLTDPYTVSVDQFNTVVEAIICEGEVYPFNGNNLNATGFYTVELQTAEGCDSTARLDLTVEPIAYAEISEIICTGSQYQLGSNTYSDSGIYQETLISSAGCDSIVTLTLEVLPPTAFINLEELKVLKLGEEVRIDPGVINSELNSFNWLDETGVNFSEDLILNWTPVASTWLYFEAVDLNNCPISDSIFLRVDKDYSVYLPNAFSPNGDGVNDGFTIYGSSAIEEIESLQIFNRWGSLVFTNSSFPVNEPSQGWDGKFNGKTLQGVFTFLAQVRYIDGHVRQVSGDVSLIK